MNGQMRCGVGSDGSDGSDGIHLAWLAKVFSDGLR